MVPASEFLPVAAPTASMAERAESMAPEGCFHGGVGLICGAQGSLHGGGIIQWWWWRTHMAAAAAPGM
jgi:hypothetical protein